MTVGQVLADLGVHKMQKSVHVLAWDTRFNPYGDRELHPAYSWVDYLCTCGFRATVEPAIPDDMVQDWHDKAML